MATAQVDMPTQVAAATPGSAATPATPTPAAPAPTGILDSITFANPRQFAWKSVLLALATVALVPVLLWKHVLAAQVYLGALVVIHVAAIAIFAVKTRKEDIAPSPFGLFWRVVGLVVVTALLASIRLVPDTALFWPALFGIWALHTAGLALLHVRAKDGAGCPFLPGAWPHRV